MKKKKNDSGIMSAVRKMFMRIGLKELVIGVFLIIVFAVFSCVTESIGGTNYWNNFSGFLGVVTTFFSYLAWAEAKRIRRDRENFQVEDLRKNSGSQVCLIIETELAQIKDTAINYLENSTDVALRGLVNEELNNYKAYQGMKRGGFTVSTDSQKKVVTLCMPKMPANDKERTIFFDEYTEVLSSILGAFKVSGFNTINLFTNMPTIMSVYTGEAFKNQFRLVAYHYDVGSANYFRAFSGGYGQLI